MTIAIEEETKVDFDFDYKKVIEAVVNQAMDYKNCPYEAEVSVTLTDNDSIHAINKEFRNIDNPTDVLSFPLVEYEEAGQFDFLEDRDDCFNPESGELMLGDIVISVEKLYEQADKYGHSPKRELAFLTAHSMLHLFGYDHMTPEEAAVMEKGQEEILAAIGITRG